KAAVTYGPGGLLRWPPVDEPGHGRTKPVQRATGNASLDLSEVALEGDHVAAHRRPARRARVPALLVHRPQQRLRVERVQSQLRLDENPAQVEIMCLEQGRPGQALHDEKRAAERGSVRARKEDPGRGVAETGE